VNSRPESAPRTDGQAVDVDPLLPSRLCVGDAGDDVLATSKLWQDPELLAAMGDPSAAARLSASASCAVISCTLRR
jgi:hypothetical protein